MSDSFEITNPEILNRIESINNGTIKDIVTSGQAREIEAVVTDTLSGGELANIVEGEWEQFIPDGTVQFGHWEGTSFTDAPVTSTTAIAKTTPAGPITEYNSNVTAIQRGRIVQPYNATVTDGKVNLSGAPASGSFGANAAYFLGEVNQAVCAAQVGIMLGKVIDSTLYNANPNFWDSHGMSSLNPETWNSITHGDDSLGASLFNMVFGLNPDNNKGQAYIDQNAFAYMAYYMAQNGVFGAGGQSYIESATIGGVTLPDLPCAEASGYTPFDYISGSYNRWRGYSTPFIAPAVASVENFLAVASGTNAYNNVVRATSIRYIDSSQVLQNVVLWIYASEIQRNTWSTIVNVTPQQGVQPYSSGEYGNGYSYTYDGRTVYYKTHGEDVGGRYGFGSFITPSSYSEFISLTRDNLGKVAWQLVYGRMVTPSPIEGITDQPNATVPDVSAWNDLASVLQSLQNQFPNVWNNAITYNQIQPDGTLKPTTYVPVGWPNTVANPWTDTKPTTNNQPTTQTQPQIDLDTLVNSQTSPLTRTLTQTPTPNPNPDLDVPQNPTDTGDGSSPTPIPPTGSASALWSVYHPTQAQVNSFGAWLWSSSFIDNLLKVFQNPMDAIISLHKVFISPVDAGSTTIHAGYLDSEVPSNYVTQQYVYKDCGYVNCYEVFGNVFDYVGTSVSLYLPFIGIVPLNVDEVMRSTVHVIYGCDLFTGAILVQVEISRDGNDVVMYQYGGDGGVQYPVSGSRSSGFLTGLAATIGAAASIATGGAALPAFAAAFGGSVMSAQKQVQHSGGFSGNSGAMGGKTPYLIIERPQTKVAQLFPSLSGYPTNKSGKLSDFEGQVVVSDVHVEGMTATDTELSMIEDLLKEGVLI